MPPATTPQDLTQALTTLQHSLSILLMHYKGPIKTFLLILMVYAFYKLGSISVKDHMQEKRQALSNLIERRTSVRVEIPRRIERVRRVSVGVLVIGGLLIVGYAVAWYLRYRPVVRNSKLILGVGVAVIVLVLSALNIYKYLLNRKFRENDSLQRSISKNLTQFSTSLGPKVTKLLKHHLCKDKLSKMHTTFSSLACQKPQCQQLRSLYKNRCDLLQELTSTVMSFQWCSICKKRQGFDECLAFQTMLFESHGETETETEEVFNKMGYLLQGIEKMRKWLQMTAPCNCSKLYWTMSTEKILKFKNRMKHIEGGLKGLEQRVTGAC